MKKHNFFGIEIEKRVDILAFLAFLFSVCTIAIKLYSHVVGANVILEKPQQIIIKMERLPASTIEKYKIPVEKQGYVNFAIDMIYYNNGSPGYSDAIKQETATLQLGTNEFHYKWQYFSIIDQNDGVLIENNKEIAGPRTIKSKEIELHETNYYPSKQYKDDGSSNFLYWGDFINNVSNKKIKNILIKLYYTTYEGGSGNSSCTIKIDNSLIQTIKDKSWVSAQCI